MKGIMPTEVDDFLISEMNKSAINHACNNNCETPESIQWNTIIVLGVLIGVSIFVTYHLTEPRKTKSQYFNNENDEKLK
ncbi:MAG: hypothetical protein PF481_08345 [Bacteroidales bacterium]|jgi:hypothetical protein|nr:hypothetical protein [Bacteroidales bacterium]